MEAPVFNAFGVILQFPVIADKLLAETARLAAKLHEAYNSLRGSLPTCKVSVNPTLMGRILRKRLLGSPQEVAEKR